MPAIAATRTAICPRLRLGADRRPCGHAQQPGQRQPDLHGPGNVDSIDLPCDGHRRTQLANTAQVIVNVGDVPISGLEVTTNNPTVFGAETTLVANAIGSNIVYEWTLGDGSPAKTRRHRQNAYLCGARLVHGHRRGDEQPGSATKTTIVGSSIPNRS